MVLLGWPRGGGAAELWVRIVAVLCCGPTLVLLAYIRSASSATGTAGCVGAVCGTRQWNAQVRHSSLAGEFVGRRLQLLGRAGTTGKIGSAVNRNHILSRGNPNGHFWAENLA